MSNRVTKFANTMRVKLKDVDVKSTAELEKGMSLKFDDHFQYQEIQARAHASGKQTLDEAQVVYMALGEVMSTKNGGWKDHVDLGLKIAITQLMAEVLAERIGKLS